MSSSHGSVHDHGPEQGRGSVGGVLATRPPGTRPPGTRLPATLLQLVIRGYQIAISPLLPPACRYYPSCSNYALEAISKYGAMHGGWLAARRIARCHPFRPGGYDPVP